MDIAMKGITGLEAAARMRERHPGVRVIILSMHSGEEYVLQALRAGAVGLSPQGRGHRRARARAAQRDPRRELAQPGGVAPGRGGLRAARRRRRRPDVLTARQREVLRLVAGGKSTKEIAFALNLSVKTVKRIARRSWSAWASATWPGSCATPCAPGSFPPRDEEIVHTGHGGTRREHQGIP